MTLLENQFHEMDALAFIKNLPPASVDLAVVDPPYNLSIADWDTFPSHDAFMQFTEAWLAALIPALKPSASLYVFNTPANAAHILVALQRMGLTYQNWIVWHKKDGFSATKTRFANTQEALLFFTKSKKGYYFNADAVRVPYESTERIAHAAVKGILKNGKRWFPNPAGKLCSDVWHFTSHRHKNKQAGKLQKSEHPTPKPEDLVERVILASSKPGDLVVDCFAGTGTTGVVAARLGRRFLCCERDAAYVAISKERLNSSLPLTSNKSDECPAISKVTSSDASSDPTIAGTILDSTTA